MAAAPLFRLEATTTFPIGRNECAVLRRRDGRVSVVDALTAKVLSSLSGLRSLEEHAAIAWRTGVTADPYRLQTTFEGLLSEGLLSPAPVALGEPHSSRCPVGTVAIVTADRPAELKRCVASLSGATRQGRSKRKLLVVDGSVRCGDDNRGVLERWSQTNDQFDLAHVDRRGVAALARRLSDAGINPTTASYALEGGSIGSNRNVAVLLSAGSGVVMLDDDVVCTAWEPEGALTNVSIAGHGECRSWQFFEDRRAATSVDLVDRDIAAAHESLLGANLWDFGGSLPDMRSACGHLTGTVVHRDAVRVAATFAGLAGDSARYCSHRVLLLSGDVRNVLMSDEAQLASALKSREVRRVALRPTITHDSSCMSYCMGLANLEVVPPFFPGIRGEDTVFGAVLAASDPDAVFGHLPLGVLHLSNRSAAYGTSAAISARQTRMADWHVALLAMAPMNGSVGRCSRLERLARWYRDLGQMPHAQFAEIAIEGLLAQRARELNILEVSLAQNGSHLWREEVSGYITAVRGAITRRAFFTPVDCVDREEAMAPFIRVQHEMRSVADLLELWPAMWTLARDWAA